LAFLGSLCTPYSKWLLIYAAENVVRQRILGIHRSIVFHVNDGPTTAIAADEAVVSCAACPLTGQRDCSLHFLYCPHLLCMPPPVVELELGLPLGCGSFDCLSQQNVNVHGILMAFRNYPFATLKIYALLRVVFILLLSLSLKSLLRFGFVRVQQLMTL